MPDHSSPSTFRLYRASTRLAGVFAAFAVGVYAYLGLFSRHLADDFCSVGFVRSNFFVALWNNYLTVSDRFSNFMLIALSESLWPGSVALLPAAMLTLWVFGIALFLRTLNILRVNDWLSCLALASLLVFFALLQAPNRYQTLYWRSSMATHFAPLVFMPYLAAFILRSVRSLLEKPLSRWAYPGSFGLAFLLGGFSEPTVLIMIFLLGCAVFASWLLVSPSKRTLVLRFLAWPMAGALLALLVMALAPANSLRLGDPPPALPDLVARSFLYAYQFLLNAILTLPLPAFFTFAIPLIFLYGLYAHPAPALDEVQRRMIGFLLVIVPVLSYLLIVASFAPSVYGQSYPVERARFAGQLCLVTALMITGGAVGVWMAQWRPGLIRRLPLHVICAGLLGVASLYPLRAALLTLQDLPGYRDRAELWDARDGYVLRHAAAGETDIFVPGFPGVYGIKEWDNDQSHWVNVCAAQYYEVNSVRAFPVPEEYVQDIGEYLSE